MSERTFFALRYAVPGYAFVLIIISVAYPELQNILPQIADAPVVGAFLAFLTVLGGGTLGFLVSQVWYVAYIHLIAERHPTFLCTIAFLSKRYGLRKNRKRQVFFLDYVHRLSNDKLQVYTQRRYDLMLLCGSTLVSTLIGAIFGVSVRLYLSGPSLDPPDNALMMTGFVFIFLLFLVATPRARKRFPSALPITIFLSLGPAIFLLLFPKHIHTQIISLMVAGLVFLLFQGLEHAMKEHAMASEISVHEVWGSGKFPPWKAIRAFPRDYFDPQAFQRISASVAHS